MTRPGPGSSSFTRFCVSGLLRGIILGAGLALAALCGVRAGAADAENAAAGAAVGVAPDRAVGAGGGGGGVGGGGAGGACGATLVGSFRVAGFASSSSEREEGSNFVASSRI